MAEWLHSAHPPSLATNSPPFPSVFSWKWQWLWTGTEVTPLPGTIYYTLCLPLTEQETDAWEQAKGWCYTKECIPRVVSTVGTFCQHWHSGKTRAILKRCPISLLDELITFRGVSYLPKGRCTLTSVLAKNTSCTPQQVTIQKHSSQSPFYPIASRLLRSRSNLYWLILSKLRHPRSLAHLC